MASSDSQVEVRIVGSIDGSLAASASVAKAEMAGLGEASAVSAAKMSDALKAVGGDVRKITPEMLGLSVAAGTATKVAATGARLADDATKGLNATTSGAIQEYIRLGHEVMTGNFSRVPGSITVLANRMGGLQTVTSMVSGATLLVGTAAVAAAGGLAYLIYRSLEAEKTIDDLSEGFAMTGRNAEMGADGVRYELGFLEQLPSASRAAADGFLHLAAQHASWSAVMVNEVGQLLPAFVKSYGKDAPQAAAKLMDALNDLSLDGFKKLDREMLNLRPEEYELIENLIRTGNTAEATSRILADLSERTGIYIKSLGDQVYDIEQKIVRVEQRIRDVGGHPAGFELQLKNLETALAHIRELEAGKAQADKDAAYKRELDAADKINEKLDARGAILQRLKELQGGLAEAQRRGDLPGAGKFTTAIAEENTKLAEADKAANDKIFRNFQENEDAKAALYKSGSAQRIAIAEQEAVKAKEIFGAQSNEYLHALARLNEEKRAAAEAGARIDSQTARKEAEEEVAFARYAAQQVEQIRKSNLQTETELGRIALREQKSILAEEVADHQKTAQEKYDETVTLLTKEADANEKALKDDERRSGIQLAQIKEDDNKIKIIDAQKNADIAAAARQLTVDLRAEDRKRLESWRDVDRTILDSEGELVRDILTKRQSLARDLQQVGAKILVDELVATAKAVTAHELANLHMLASDKAVAEEGLLFKLGVYLAEKLGFIAATTAETAAAATGVGAEKAITAPAHATAAESNAAVAATAAASAAAGLGPAAAAAAAALTFAELQPYVAVASLDVGTPYVPHDMAAIVHQGEMVIPEEFASGIRSMMAGGARAAGGALNVGLNVNAIDARSFLNFINNPVNMRVLASRLSTAMDQNPSYRPRY